MTLRALYLAAPLALGIACSHSSGAKSQGTASAGATGESGAASASAAPGTTAGPHTIVMGRVSQASSDQVVIETMDGRHETLSLQNQPTITVDGQVAHASDLQPGQMVRAAYDEQSGQKNAVSIQAGHHGMDSTGHGGPAGQGGDPDTSGAGQAGDTGASGDSGYQSPGASGTGSGGVPDSGPSPSDSSSSTGGKW